VTRDHCHGSRIQVFLPITGLFSGEWYQAIQIFDIKAKFTIRPRVVHQIPSCREKSTARTAGVLWLAKFSIGFSCFCAIWRTDILPQKRRRELKMRS